MAHTPNELRLSRKRLIDFAGRSNYSWGTLLITLADGSVDHEGLLTRRGREALLHEHAHLMQQVATVYGIVDYMNLLDDLGKVEENLRAGTAPLSAPVNEIRSVRSARLASEDWPGRDFDWVAAYTTTEEVAGHKILRSYVQVLEVGGDGQLYTHPLGAVEVAELHAVAATAIAARVNPTLTQAEYRYRIADGLLGSYFATTSWEHKLVFAHWALQLPTPGPGLLQLLAASIERFGDRLPGAEELYNFLRNLAVAMGLEDSIARVHAMLKYYVEYYSGRPFPDPRRLAAEWLLETSQRTTSLLLDPDRQFPLDSLRGVARNGLGPGSPILQEVPLTLAAHDKGILTSGSSAAQAALVLLVAEDLLIQIDRDLEPSPCPIMRFCPMTKTDECDRSPWNRVHEDGVCLYRWLASAAGLG